MVKYKYGIYAWFIALCWSSVSLMAMEEQDPFNWNPNAETQEYTKEMNQASAEQYVSDTPHYDEDAPLVAPDDPVVSSDQKKVRAAEQDAVRSVEQKGRVSSLEELQGTKKQTRKRREAFVDAHVDKQKQVEKARPVQQQKRDSRSDFELLTGLSLPSDLMGIISAYTHELCLKRIVKVNKYLLIHDLALVHGKKLIFRVLSEETEAHLPVHKIKVADLASGACSFTKADGERYRDFISLMDGRIAVIDTQENGIKICDEMSCVALMHHVVDKERLESIYRIWQLASGRIAALTSGGLRVWDLTKKACIAGCDFDGAGRLSGVHVQEMTNNRIMFAYDGEINVFDIVLGSEQRLKAKTSPIYGPETVALSDNTIMFLSDSMHAGRRAAYEWDLNDDRCQKLGGEIVNNIRAFNNGHCLLMYPGRINIRDKARDAGVDITDIGAPVICCAAGSHGLLLVGTRHYGDGNALKVWDPKIKKFIQTIAVSSPSKTRKLLATVLKRGYASNRYRDDYLRVVGNTVIVNNSDDNEIRIFEYANPHVHALRNLGTVARMKRAARDTAASFGACVGSLKKKSKSESDKKSE